MDLIKYEKKYWDEGFQKIVGIDEAGRGPLAGPVVAASVILKPYEIIEGVKDSKKLSSKKRRDLFNQIYEKALSVGVGIVDEDIIDEINILKATFLAMKKSLGNLNLKPDKVLIDGPYSDITIYPTDYIVNGDNISQSIAAASIIAKVTRDEIMYEYDKIFPDYKFINHKGYGTKYHIEQLELKKSTPIHRRSFKIVKNNMPNYDFYLNKKNGFKKLAHQIVGVKYIKKHFAIVEQNIGISGNNINYCFIDSNNNYKFVMIRDNSSKDIIKEDIKNLLQDYLNQNNIENNYTIDVISLKFIKGKKPILKIV
ncbi:MAG: ribonuclease HII [Candidatus Marinimicrobia bacterium]|nr:ribonuclease HII [Candidatus Neomarinimicrobiota bacterium]|tara:strand:- start:6709 stop:7641 length:933 start_codon:yes stop_codon:yes gene_type:complete